MSQTCSSLVRTYQSWWELLRQSRTQTLDAVENVLTGRRALRIDEEEWFSSWRSYNVKATGQSSPWDDDAGILSHAITRTLCTVSMMVKQVVFCS